MTFFKSYGNADLIKKKNYFLKEWSESGIFL